MLGCEAIVFCCVVACIQPDFYGCQQDFLVVWRWNQATWKKATKCNKKCYNYWSFYEGVQTNKQTICSWIELKNVVCVCPLGSLPLCHRHCQDKENEKVNVLSIWRSILLSREFQKCPNLKIHMGVFSHHFPGRLNLKGPRT